MSSATPLTDATVKEFNLSNPEVFPLGTPEVTGVTKPRFLLEVDGELWEGFKYVTLNVSGFNMASTFALDGSYSRLGNIVNIGEDIDPKTPLGKLLAISPNRQRPRVKIYAGYTDKDEPSLEELEFLFEGVIDRVKVDHTDDAVEVVGRDLSVLFLESFTHEQFRNQTTGAVVAEIADLAGVEVGQIFDTGTEIGTAFDYEKIDFDTVGTAGENLWELILRISQVDEFKAFFWKGKFYYVPFELFDQVIRFDLGTNIETLVGEKNYSVANSRVAVEIASTDLKAKDSVTATAGPSGVGQKGDRVSIRQVVPGIGAEEAQVIAEGLALFYSQFEFVINLTTVGDSKQNILNQLVITNTGNDFSRYYRIAAVTWTFGTDAGWVSEIAGLSLPPESQVQIHRIRQRRTLTRIS